MISDLCFEFDLFSFSGKHIILQIGSFAKSIDSLSQFAPAYVLKRAGRFWADKNRI